MATVGLQCLLPKRLSDKWLIFYSVVGILPTHLITLAFAWFMVSEGGRRSLESGRMGMAGTSQTRVLISILVALVSTRSPGVTNLYGGNKTDLDLLIESSMYTRVAPHWWLSLPRR